MEVERAVERVDELLVQFRVGPLGREVDELLQRVLVRLGDWLPMVGVVVDLVEATSAREANVSHLEVALEPVGRLRRMDCHERICALVHRRNVLDLAPTQASEPFSVATGRVKGLWRLLWDRAFDSAMSPQILVQRGVETCQTLTVVLKSIDKVRLAAQIGGVLAPEVVRPEMKRRNELLTALIDVILDLVMALHHFKVLVRRESLTVLRLDVHVAELLQRLHGLQGPGVLAHGDAKRRLVQRGLVLGGKS